MGSTTETFFQELYGCRHQGDIKNSIHHPILQVQDDRGISTILHLHTLISFNAHRFLYKIKDLRDYKKWKNYQKINLEKLQLKI